MDLQYIPRIKNLNSNMVNNLTKEVPNEGK